MVSQNLVPCLGRGCSWSSRATTRASFRTWSAWPGRSGSCPTPASAASSLCLAARRVARPSKAPSNTAPGDRVLLPSSFSFSFSFSFSLLFSSLLFSSLLVFSSLLTSFLVAARPGSVGATAVSSASTRTPERPCACVASWRLWPSRSPRSASGRRRSTAWCGVLYLFLAPEPI